MATKQQVPVLAARLVEFQEEFSVLSTEEAQWAIMNGKEAAALSAKAIANRITNEVKHTSIVKLISAGKKLMIEALDGKAAIVDAKQTFSSLIDFNFANLRPDLFNFGTSEILVDVCEMNEKGSFLKIFTSINPDLDEIVMTQAQIIRFCEKYPTWLSQHGRSTFFLTNLYHRYVVIRIITEAKGLQAILERFDCSTRLSSRYYHRFVSPQFIPSLA